MIVEIMYEEFYLYGEKATVKYFEKLLDKAEFVYTSYRDKPYFVDNKVDLIYIASMSEYNMDRIYKKLLPYRQDLINRIEEGTYFIGVNNILDLFAKELEVLNGPESKSLAIFDYKAVRNYDKRHSDIVLANYKNNLIMGNLIGFSEYYGNENSFLYESLYPNKAFNSNTNKGGFRYKNAFLIELGGSIFLTNPFLAKELRKHFMGDDNIPMLKEMEFTYNENIRLQRNHPEFSKAIKKFEDEYNNLV